MKLNNWFVPALISLGLILILFSTLVPQSKINLGSDEKELAKIVEKSGSVFLQNTEISVQVDLNINQVLKKNDLIRTDKNSSVLINFYNGGQFRLPEQTEVLLDKTESGAPLVVVRTGEIFIEKFGKPPGYSVRQNGQIYDSVDYALIDHKNTQFLKEPIPDQRNKELATISQQEIEQTLNSKKNDFFKCFGQLIQKNPQASGQVLLSFTIEKQGHTSKLEIAKSEILDVSFKSCLIEVVGRTKFRAFTGDPVTTIFPLKFE